MRPKRITGTLLFRIMMWKYALRRQKEEMDEGIIPWKELPQNNEDLSKLRPRNLHQSHNGAISWIEAGRKVPSLDVLVTISEINIYKNKKQS